MASDGDAFLKRKFMHLFKCFEHSRKGFIVKEDADIHCKQLESILRGQLEREGLTNDAIEKRILDFRMDWLPSAMGYFGELSKFAQNNEEISKEDFMAFNMSIRDHIAQHDALPLWFDNSLRMSYAKCWSSKNGLLFEDGLELLPGESLSLVYRNQMMMSKSNLIAPAAIYIVNAFRVLSFLV